MDKYYKIYSIYIFDNMPYQIEKNRLGYKVFILRNGKAHYFSKKWLKSLQDAKQQIKALILSEYRN